MDIHDALGHGVDLMVALMHQLPLKLHLHLHLHLLLPLWPLLAFACGGEFGLLVVEGVPTRVSSRGGLPWRRGQA